MGDNNGIDAAGLGDAGDDEGGQEVGHATLGMSEEAVGGLGGRPGRAGLRQGSRRTVLPGGQEPLQTSVQTRIGETGSGNLGPAGAGGDNHEDSEVGVTEDLFYFTVHLRINNPVGKSQRLPGWGAGW